MGSQAIGYLAALAALLSWTIGTFAFTQASRRAEPASVNRVRILYAFVALSIWVCFSNQFSFSKIFSQANMAQYFWFSLSGFIGLTLGDYYAFTGFKILGSRRASLFFCFAPCTALLTAMLLVDETLSWVGIIGMMVSVSGIILLSLSRTEQDEVMKEGHGNFKKGILFATLGGVCQGIGLTLAKKGFQVPGNSITVIYATWIRMLSASLFVYLIGAVKVNLWSEFKSITFNREKLIPVLAGTLFGPVMAISFSLLAVIHLEVAVAQTLFSLLPVSILFISVFLHKERVHSRSYFAVLISIIGVLILVFRQSFK